jgi:murein tripeptide amidase MpaA
MTAMLKTEAAHCPLLRLTSLGQSAHGHKEIWLVRVADPNMPPVQTVRLLILCRQHGDEPASTEAVLKLLHGIAGGHDPIIQAGLAQVTLYVVPMVNPDGADALTRRNGVGGPCSSPDYYRCP